MLTNHEGYIGVLFLFSGGHGNVFLPSKRCTHPTIDLVLYLVSAANRLYLPPGFGRDAKSEVHDYGMRAYGDVPP